jgi:hypothetical protein
MHFPHFNINPSKHTFVGIVLGIFLVAAARAFFHF